MTNKYFFIRGRRACVLGGLSLVQWMASLNTESSCQKAEGPPNPSPSNLRNGPRASGDCRSLSPSPTPSHVNCHHPHLVRQFPGAAVTERHKPGGLGQVAFFEHSSGGWKSFVEVERGRGPSEGARGGSVPGLSLAPGGSRSRGSITPPCVWVFL